MPYTLNMDSFGAFRVPETLSFLLMYVLEKRVVAGAHGGLVLADGEDRFGRFEPGRGAREPLSHWLERTLARLTGDVEYATSPDSEF